MVCCSFATETGYNDAGDRMIRFLFWNGIGLFSIELSNNILLSSSYREYDKETNEKLLLYLFVIHNRKREVDVIKRR